MNWDDLCAQFPHLKGLSEVGAGDPFAARIKLVPRDGSFLDCLKKGYNRSKIHNGRSLTLSTFLNQTLPAQDIKELKKKP